MMKHTDFKFMIVNGWSDMNRGDSAIVLGMLWLLQKYFPESQLCIMSEFMESDPKFITGYEDIKTFYPNVDILPALFPYPSGKNKLLKVINAGFILFRALIVLLCPVTGWLLYRGEKAKAWRSFVESDVIVSKGGHIFYWSKPFFMGSYAFLKHAFPLLLGIRMKKKTVIYAQSVGPFNGRICAKLAKWFFSKLSAISVRERISKNILYKIGVTKDIQVFPDAAFLLPISNQETQNILHTKDKKIVITPRQWHFGSKEKWNKYINTLAAITDWLIKEYGYSVVLVSHTVGPTLEEDDRIAVQNIYKSITFKEKVQIIDTTKGYTAFDMVKLYSTAHLVIGTRFHSVIFALLAGTPAIAVSYFGPKSYGIMQDLGLSDFIVDINDIDEKKLLKLIEKVFNNEAQIRNKIKEKILETRKKAEEHGIQFIRSVFTGR